jgi:hypothetical protein
MRTYLGSYSACHFWVVRKHLFVLGYVAGCVINIVIMED